MKAKLKQFKNYDEFYNDVKEASPKYILFKKLTGDFFVTSSYFIQKGFEHTLLIGDDTLGYDDHVIFLDGYAITGYALIDE